MINLRYHIVSITAVFLALAIGLALGSTLIQRGIVDTLETRLDELGERLDRTDGENADLRDEISDRDDFDRQVAESRDPLLAGHLADRPVLMIAMQGTDSDTLDEIRRSLRSANALVSGTLVFTGRWESLSADEIEELADLLDRRISIEGLARSLTMRGIADELWQASQPPPDPEPDPELELEDGEGLEGVEGLVGPDRPQIEGEETVGVDDADSNGELMPVQSPPEGEGGDLEDDPDDQTPAVPPVPAVDLIDGLVTLGYLEFIPESAAAPLPSYGASYVLIADDDSLLGDDLVALPLVEQLANRAEGSAPLVVTGQLGPIPDPDDEDDFDPADRLARLVRSIRLDDDLRLRVNTVDSLEGLEGHAGLVLTLAHLADAPVGHYGRGVGAEALWPLAS